MRRGGPGVGEKHYEKASRDVGKGLFACMAREESGEIWDSLAVRKLRA